jgi:hypothetical protein
MIGIYTCRLLPSNRTRETPMWYTEGLLTESTAYQGL